VVSFSLKSFMLNRKVYGGCLIWPTLYFITCWKLRDCIQTPPKQYLLVTSCLHIRFNVDKCIFYDRAMLRKHCCSAQYVQLTYTRTDCSSQSQVASGQVDVISGVYSVPWHSWLPLVASPLPVSLSLHMHTLSDCSPTALMSSLIHTPLYEI